MHVFVTGATGFVGSAVMRELVAAGHRVTGLVRSDAGAATLAAAGAAPCRGDLADLPGLRAAAGKADAVIHTAFIHDFTNFKTNCEIDRQAIETLGDALAGSDRPLIVTSGIGLLPQGRLAAEQAMPAAASDAHPRVATEEAADAAAARGVRVSVIRLPPSVHGDGDHGFVPILIGIARRTGVSAYIGDGGNRWPAAHRVDVARLYRLVLEKTAPGAKQESGVRYHGVAEQGIAFREIAGVIGRRLNLPVAGKTPAEAAGHFGWFARFAAMDVPATSDWTQTQLGWQPVLPGLIADLDRPGYFAA